MSLSSLHKPTWDSVQVEEPQLQQGKAGSLKAGSWVHRQHGPSLVHGLGTPSGSDFNPTLHSPASHHQSFAGDSRDMCSSVLLPAAAKAGLVQELGAQDLWHNQRDTTVHQWHMPSTFCQAQTRSSCCCTTAGEGDCSSHGLFP